MREGESQGRILKSAVIGDYTLLNHEKLGRVLDLLEGVIAPQNADEARVLADCQALGDQDMAILNMYDRLGGAIRSGERKLAMGTFYDFNARAPRNKADIDEADYSDEYVLVRKKSNKSKKSESVSDRVKRLEKTAKKEAGASSAKKPKKTAKKEETETES